MRHSLRQWPGEEIFRRLVDTVAEYALCAADVQGRILYWNAGAAHTLGYTRDEIQGQLIDIIFTEEDRAAGIPEQERRLAVAQGRAEDERWHRRKDGSRLWSAGVMIPVYSDAGELLGFGKILQDRTDQRELQEALRQRASRLAHADEDKNIFLATLAHELRTPLAVLMNSAGVLKSGKPFDAPQLAEMIERQVRHSQRLVDDLMDIVRVSRDKLQIRRERLDLRDIAQQAAEMVRPMMEKRRQVFHLEQPEAPLLVLGDGNRLLQVFVNLLNNALKFTEPHGHITFSTTSEGHEAVARIDDDGAGIPPERLASIFDLFSQAHPGLSGSQLGLGIGLALTRDLVALHGGSIQARSAGLGKGSQFSVRLPLITGVQSIHA